jgi:hypothetical protein
MSDPKNIDWNEVVEDAQRLDMLRLQNEQTNLLKNMSSGSNPDPVYREPSPKEAQEFLERKYGFRKEDNPVEWERLRKEAFEEERLHKLEVAKLVANDEARRLEVLARRSKRKPWLIAGAVLVGLWFFGNLLF